MPIYEYVCNDCDQEFEKLVPFSQTEKAPICPQCQSENTKKKVSVFASAASQTTGGFSGASSCGSSGRFT